ncbi:MAG: HEAT repeat domain-containing protein [Planctomycetes bacterium]|nr:HEAT repeat domain-containing protein [Planctomycetota bacterium]
MSFRPPSMPLLLLLVPVLLVGAPSGSSLAAPDEDSTSFPTGPGGGVPVRSLSIGTAALSFRDGQTVLTVQGQADYPDYTTLDVVLGLREEVTDFKGSAKVIQKQFSATCMTPLRLFPGYYRVSVMFQPWRQDDAMMPVLDGFPKQVAIFPLQAGTSEEAADAKKKTLEFYESQLKWIETQYQPFRKAFMKLMEGHSPTEAAAKWDEEFKDIPAIIEQHKTEVDEFTHGMLCSVFPSMHQWVANGIAILAGVFRDLREGLIVEMTAMMLRKMRTRAWFLQNADKAMFGHLKSVRAQIVLEKNAELRDHLVYLVGRLYWLFDQSQQTFRVARSMDPERAREPWTQFMTDSRNELKTVETDLKPIGTGPLRSEFPELVNAILLAPEALRAMWMEYDAAVLKGAPNEGRLSDAEALAYGRIVPIMECLDFNKEVTNPVGTVQEFTPGDPVEENPSGEPTPEDIEKATKARANLGDYIARNIEKFASAGAADRFKILRIVTSFKSLALEPLKKGLESDRENVPLCCAVALSWLGDKAGRSLLKEAAQNQPDDGLRSLAVGGLGILAVPEDRPGVERALKEDKSPLVRSSAATGLGQMDLLEAVPALIDALADAEFPVRTAAKSAIEALVARTVEFMPNAAEDQRAAQRENVRRWWQRVESEVRAKRAEREGAGKSK